MREEILEFVITGMMVRVEILEFVITGIMVKEAIP